MSGAEVVADILAHHGVKGQKWGIRKESESSTEESTRAKSLEQYSKSQAAAMNSVAVKMEKAYGFKVDEFALFNTPEAKKYFPDTDKNHYLAMVAPKKKGDTRNVIHVMNNPNYKTLLDTCEKVGWFPPSGGRLIEANITHEAAHGFFHHNDASGKGVTREEHAAIAPLRRQAWGKAHNQAIVDGDITSHDMYTGHYQMAGKISKYAHQSPFIYEHEAELFSAYHWSPNPPKFVDTFMNDIHESIGKNVQPFSGRRVSRAS